jgi:hypothetical protein
MRKLLVAAACLLLIAGSAAPARAGAAAAAACPGTGSGVTVVVDFSALGGGVEIACAPGDPASGLAALQGAGFGWTGTTRFPSFVCRIDGLPTPDQDRCVNTPPATAYWAYWYAERGGAWNYSSSGGASHDPEPGDVDGWAFGSGGRPGVAPPAAPAPRPPREDPPEQQEQPREPRQPREDPPAPDQPGAEEDPDRPDAEPDQPGPSEPAGSPTPTGTTSAPPPPSRDSGGPEAVPGNPVARTSSGSPLGVVIGLGLVVALGAAAWLVNRRRART